MQFRVRVEAKLNMLDLKFVIANLELIKENCKKRGCNLDLDEIAALDRKRREQIKRLEAIRHEINELSKSKEEGEKSRERVKELKEQEYEYSSALDEIQPRLEEKVAWLPNILDPRVPIGGEDKNAITKTVGQIRQFDFQPKSHEELGKLLNLIDIPRGVKLAKARFYCMKNDAVKMRWALAQMFIAHVKEQGFELISPPYLAKAKTLFTSGYLPFSQKDNFKISDEDLSLIGTSEQALLGMHMDEILPDLPLLYLGDSMCFRTEAGNYGRDTAGIFRVHQFYKLEQIVYCEPKDSPFWHEKCLENSEWLMQELHIPYRVVLTASEDIGAPGMIKYDIEGWFPSQGKYREMTSDTNIGDYQTRRGNIRFKKGKEKIFPHTISATGFCDRLILGLMENHQRADGAIEIPEKLVPYLGGLTLLSPPTKR